MEAAQTEWVRFARTGDAGWPGYTLDERQVLAFDLPSELVRLVPPAVIGR
ncbi:hypothetical protein N8J89_15990 [Crossiella sp. CA-258035]|nr:hypothetical protein [Crossiella sp. CA-258035]WHT22504.1 hypothetical protein N8J89_15990 [Crossiella sp. CA-258035]